MPRELLEAPPVPRFTESDLVGEQSGFVPAVTPPAGVDALGFKVSGDGVPRRSSLSTDASVRSASQDTSPLISLLEVAELPDITGVLEVKIGASLCTVEKWTNDEITCVAPAGEAKTSQFVTVKYMGYQVSSSVVLTYKK